MLGEIVTAGEGLAAHLALVACLGDLLSFRVVFMICPVVTVDIPVLCHPGIASCLAAHRAVVLLGVFTFQCQCHLAVGLHVRT